MKMVRIVCVIVLNISLWASENKPKYYNIEQFLKASNKELRAHKKQLDALEKEGKLRITPSQAQLFYSHKDPVFTRKHLKDDLRFYADKQDPWTSPRWWGVDVSPSKKIKALNQAMEKEQEIYNKGDITVYHSTKSRSICTIIYTDKRGRSYS